MKQTKIELYTCPTNVSNIKRIEVIMKPKKNKTPKKFTHQEWVKSVECDNWKGKIVEKLMYLVVAMSVKVLLDDFSFSKEQLQKFRLKIEELSRDMNNGYFTDKDLIEAMENETGVKG